MAEGAFRLSIVFQNARRFDLAMRAATEWTDVPQVMIAGLSGSLHSELIHGLKHTGLPHAVAQKAGDLPAVSTLFASVLGVNPIHHILVSSHAIASLPAHTVHTLTGRAFFPHLIAGAFHSGLQVVFLMSIALSLIATVASLMRGGSTLPE